MNNRLEEIAGINFRNIRPNYFLEQFKTIMHPYGMEYILKAIELLLLNCLVYSYPSALSPWCCHVLVKWLMVDLTAIWYRTEAPQYSFALHYLNTIYNAFCTSISTGDDRISPLCQGLQEKSCTYVLISCIIPLLFLLHFILHPENYLFWVLDDT